MSDSDSAFKGDNRSEDQNFQKILSDNNAVLEPVKLNDHHALGVIDVFAKNLNRVLSKEFLENNKARWKIYYQRLLNNTTAHHTQHLIISHPIKQYQTLKKGNISCI